MVASGRSAPTEIEETLRMISPAIDADCLWQTILNMAEIDATSDGIQPGPSDRYARTWIIGIAEPARWEAAVSGMADRINSREKN
jgi:hypothetical protein